MHIAFWSPAWPFQRFQNGIITYVHMMKIELERLGHRVSVFTPVLDQAAVDNNVHYVDTNHRTLWARTARRLFRSRATVEGDYELIAGAIAAAILRVHKRDPIDLIEMEESFGWFSKVETGTALPMVVKLHGPAFLSYVDNELDTPFAQKRIELEGMALSRALTVLSPCQITLSQTLEKYALSPRLAGHIVNPVVLEETTPLWALDTCDRCTILFVGRFDLRKGADIMLNCFLLLLKERPALRLIFVGPDVGLAHSDGSRTNFDAYCDKLFSPELRKSIEYRGPLTNHEIAGLRVKAFATIVPSRWENQGYALLEAMMQGCPVVSSDAGGCPEVVVDWTTGRLARNEDPADFAEKILSLLDDPERAATMGLAGRLYVLDRHSAETVALRSVEFYERAVKLRRH